MLPVTRGAIARMGSSLPDKQRAANTILQSVPFSGQAKPDRPLALTASRNRPAPGARSNEGDRDSRTQSKPHEAWLEKVWKGQRAPPFRCGASDGDAVGGGLCPRRDRTQISETKLESLHKCALDLFGLRVTA